MISDMAEECAKIGLGLHPEKTKILHNNKGYGRNVVVANVGEMAIGVLRPESSTMYLGRLLSLTDSHDTELQHRIRKAWAKFGVYKEALTNKDVPLKLRLKLFNSAVSPTLLYGCSSWVLTAAKAQKLQIVQMRMMRSIIGSKRKHDKETNTKETWVT